MAKLSAREKAELEIPRRLYSVEQTGVILDISGRTIYNGVSSKKFPIKPIRIGRSIKFDIHDINRYIDSLKEVKT